jgi:hypothetical protein
MAIQASANNTPRYLAFPGAQKILKLTIVKAGRGALRRLGAVGARMRRPNIEVKEAA